jgi:hypothetical protein
MNAIEFKTKIKNGIIEIPEEFKKIFKDNVKVILLSENVMDTSSDIIEELLKSPLKITNFKPYNREELYERN